MQEGKHPQSGCFPQKIHPSLMISWGKDHNKVDYCSVVFKKVFSSVEGKAALLDEYLSHTSANLDQPNVRKARVEKSDMKFHCLNVKDLDALGEICLTMETEILEVTWELQVCGIEVTCQV